MSLLLPLVQDLKYHLKWKKVYQEQFAHLPDRQIFHDVLLPYLVSKPTVHEILDVGCEWYNLHHRRAFKGKGHTSIDIEEDRRAYGAKNHVTGSVLELESYFGKEKFDLTIANGIIGYGVSAIEDIRTMGHQLAATLRPNGYVLIGWNNHANQPDVNLAEAFAEAGLSPSNLPQHLADGYRHLANKNSDHWFELFQKTTPEARISCAA